LIKSIGYGAIMALVGCVLSGCEEDEEVVGTAEQELVAFML